MVAGPRMMPRIVIAEAVAAALAAGRGVVALETSVVTHGFPHPEGLRVAVAHYGGVTLWFPNAQATPETFAWKGSHLDVMFSTDGRFLVTSMQEATLAFSSNTQ